MIHPSPLLKRFSPNRQIFAALVPMLDTGRGYEAHRIVSTLKSIERIAQGGGESYVVRLASGVTDPEPAKYFELLEDHACKRALGFHADWIHQHIDDRDMTGKELLCQAELNLAKARIPPNLADASRLSEHVWATLERIETKQQDQNRLSHPTGLATLDVLLPALPCGALLLIGGRATQASLPFSLAMQIAVTHVFDRKASALLLSPHGRSRLAEYVVACQSRIPIHRIDAGTLAEADFETLSATAKQAADLPLMLAELPRSLVQLDSILRRERSRHQTQIALIHLTDESIQSPCDVAGRLAQLSSELSITVIVTMQYSDFEAVVEEPAYLGFYDVADVVIVPRFEGRQLGRELDVVLAVPKNRHGGVGKARVQFDTETARFTDRMQALVEEAWPLR